MLIWLPIRNSAHPKITITIYKEEERQIKIHSLTLIHALISIKMLPPVFWALSWQIGAVVCCSVPLSGPPECFQPCPVQLLTRCIPLSVDCPAALFGWRRQKWNKQQQSLHHPFNRRVRWCQKPHRMLQQPALFSSLKWIPVNCSRRGMLWEDRGSGNVRVPLISSLWEEPQPEGSNAAAGTNMTSDTTERQDDLFLSLFLLLLLEKFRSLWYCKSGKGALTHYANNPSIHTIRIVINIATTLNLKTTFNKNSCHNCHF